MFGDRSLALRGRLADVRRGIDRLASDTATSLDPQAPQEPDLLAAPHVFLVCGEINAGKSTLLNGLFGRPLCSVNRLPETQQIQWFRHGPADRDHEAARHLHERYRREPFLRDFELIDTPGTNSPALLEAPDLCDPLFERADLILAVFSTANPWAPSAWDFLTRIPASALDRTVIIVQQADLKTPADLEIIRGHMRDLAIRRLGHALRVFAVSAQQAFDSKNNGGPPAGCVELEDYIDFHVCESPARRQAFRNGVRHASEALRAIESQLEVQRHAVRDEALFLEELENEIDVIRERFVVQLPDHLSEVAEVFEREALEVSKTLHRRLGIVRSAFRLFFGDRTGSDMESLFIDRLQAAVESVAATDGEAATEACEIHWRRIVERVKSRLEVDLDSAAPIGQRLEPAKRRFVSRLSNAAREGIGQLKVRNQLDKELRRRNLSLKSFTAVTLVLFILASASGIAGWSWIPWILLSLAGLFLVGGAVTALLTRRGIVAEFRSRLLNTCGGYATTLRGDYEEALRLVFQDYAGTLDEIRKHLAARKVSLESRLKRWQELFLTLKAIEQDF